MTYIIMGVSGCGKSSVGMALARQLNIPFYDGDDFHSQSNIDKMASGQALNDEDRKPWLINLSEMIRQWNIYSGAVLACSALKQSYREILAEAGDVRFVHLTGSKQIILERMQARQHFMPSTLLDSQFNTLESPKNAIDVAINLSIAEQIELICSQV